MSSTAGNDELSQALARRAEPEKATTVRDLIERMKPEIARALPGTITPDNLVRAALTELRRTPKLYGCSSESLLACVMLSAQLGLQPGPLGHVYFVPFKGQATWILGYRGMVELAYRSSAVKDVAAEIVREGDEFDYREGTRPFLDHRPAGPPDDREWTHVYAVARLRTGGTPFVVLYPSDVERLRARSASASRDDSPWNTDTAAMWRKTAIRQLERWIPKSPAFARALDVDASGVVELDDVIDADTTESTVEP